MENFPLEIIFDIVSRLPVETMIRCKHVCKAWRKLLDHVKVGTLFAIGYEEWCPRARLFYTEKAYDEIDLDGEMDVYEVSTYNRDCHPLTNLFDNDILVGSCNGLVCMATVLIHLHEPIFVFNPFIPDELINLPQITNLDYGPLQVVSGFGYACSTDEYKVVRIYYAENDDDQYVGRVEVYTIGSGHGWRNKGEISYGLCDSPGVHVDGVLHWLDFTQRNIVAFDLVTEEFRVLPSPPCFWITEIIGGMDVSNPFGFLEDNFQLHVLGGYLCLIHKNNGKRLEIWALKKNGKEHKYEWVWSKEFSMECLEKDHTYEPFAITMNNKLLLWYDKYTLVCYDPKIAVLSKLSDYKCISEDVNNYFQAIPHIKSSVSVAALEGGVQEISAYPSKRHKNNLGTVTWLEHGGKSAS